MNDRRLSTLDLLARIERERLRAVAQRHSALQSDIKRLEQQEANLGDRIEVEAIATTAEAAPYVGAFISAIRVERAQCEQQRAQLRREAGVLEEELRQRFREQKVFEIALDRKRRAIVTEQSYQGERERLETILLRETRLGAPTKLLAD